MPYTPEELRKLTWYQNLIKADERNYLANRELLVNNAATSNESQLIRNESNQVLIFEDPEDLTNYNGKSINRKR